MKKTEEISNTIKLLRFPFSMFLLPVTLFSLYFIRPDWNSDLILLLFIWHCLVFPASNGYNSYHDRDEGPIGGLGSPPKPTKSLLLTVFVFDSFALVLSLLVNVYFTLFVLGYITASRLYSNRSIRLKKYPFYSFAIVFIFQGLWVFCGNIIAFDSAYLYKNPSVIYAAIASSLFIGTLYPITQIYQHKADREAGVRTLSMVLGLKQTFLFSSVLFGITTLLLYLSFKSETSFVTLWLFLVIMLPALLFFISWAWKSFSNKRHINFRNTMVMVILSSILNNIYFIVLLLK